MSDDPSNPAGPVQQESVDQRVSATDARRSSRGADRLAIVVCYFLAAALFDQLDVSIAVGLIGVGLYFCIYKRNPKAIAFCVSLALSFFLFQWAGGRIVRAMIGRSYAINVDHRMAPNSIAMQTNSDGVRCNEEAEAFSADDYNIIFCGDSFVYGLFIKNTDDVFPYVVEKLCRERNDLPRVHCVDFGWTSSSPLLSLRLLKDIGKKYKPDLVVLAVDMTDFHDDLRYHFGQQYVGVSAVSFLAYKLDMSYLTVNLTDRFRQKQWLDSIDVAESIIPDDRFFAMNQPLEASEPLMLETENNLIDMGDYCENTLQCKFMAVMIPRACQYSDRESPDNWEADAYEINGPYVLEPFEWMKQLDERTSFPCRSILDAFRRSKEFPLYKEDDPHWNVAGHRVAARAFYDLLLKERFLP